MKISIVIPSYNQAQFIQETLESIRRQEVEKEVIIVDAASNDGTLEIIRNNSDIISYFISEPDNGQADALRKGFEQATGDIFCWLNSDDKFKDNTLSIVLSTFKESDADIVHGDMQLIDSNSKVIGFRLATPWLPNFLQSAIFIGGYGFYQPSTFWKKEVYHQVGGINPNFQFCVDNDLFARFIIAGAKTLHVNKVLSKFRVHENSKTCNLQEIANSERRKVTESYVGNMSQIHRLIVKNLARIFRVIFLLTTKRGHVYIKQKLTSDLNPIP